MGTAYLSLGNLPGCSQVKYHGFELKLHSLWQKQGKNFRPCWLQAPMHSFTVLCWIKVGKETNHLVIAVAWLKTFPNMLITWETSIFLQSLNSAGPPSLPRPPTHFRSWVGGLLYYIQLCCGTLLTHQSVSTPDLSLWCLGTSMFSSFILMHYSLQLPQLRDDVLPSLPLSLSALSLISILYQR